MINQSLSNRFNIFCKNRQHYSQLKQDLFVLFILGEDPGCFVEFGASDGIYLSNTFLLETYYNWTGLLAEPSKHYSNILKQKRNVFVETLCVSNQTGEQTDFIEVSGLAGLSGMSQYAFDDMHSNIRKTMGSTYQVETISLSDLLNKYNLPKTIDYLSIDTEGSEFSILEAYDFSRKFKVITVEHNYTNSKQRINDLLSLNGYVQVLSEESRWDSWYIHSDILNSLKINESI